MACASVFQEISQEINLLDADLSASVGADCVDNIRKCILVALRTDGMLLTQIAPQYRADPSLVAVAVNQNWRAFSSAAATLRNDVRPPGCEYNLFEIFFR